MTKREELKKLEPLIPVADTVKELKRFGVKVGYTGLMHYRNLGLIPSPTKIKGFKERFYDVDELASRINAVNLTSSIFALNFKDIAKLVKLLPDDIFNALPLAFMKIYTDLYIPFEAKDKKGRKRSGESPLTSSTLLVAIRTYFLGLVKAKARNAEWESPEVFYFKTIKGGFKELVSQMLGLELSRMKKRRMGAIKT